ncbi:CRE-SRD-15 protein [Caenorhabditis remanei]|uniref:CRE-SRD-15 protein n=1 Tax=Caenorhabditis remanei TaxID=31234 RepID=E3LUH9_CAERE|nr:CRE-SRD-15 protein [Caenorhabditis remanei]
MVHDHNLAVFVQSWHIFFGVLGAILNGLLVLLAIFKSPMVIRLYSKLIINFAVTDLLACLLDMFIEIRLLPSPNEATMTYILNGFCTYFELTTCTIGLSLFIHTLTHSLWSLLISFGYRYVILFNASLKTKHVLITLLIFYIPSLIQAATYWTNFVDRSTILPIAKRVYPEYDFETEPGLLTGITNLFSVSATYAILHMTLPITPVYITIFILRRSITKTLMKSHSIMSKETKAVHAQLLKALTFQAVIPVAAWTAVYVYIAMQFGLIRGVIFEYLIFSTVIFMPVISPVTYLIYVRPFRQFLLRTLCRKCAPSAVGDKNRTKFYTQYDYSTTRQ